MSYCGIGLFSPQNHINIGGVLRAAYCYSAAFVAVSNTKYRKAVTDTMCAHKQLPLFVCDSLKNVIPFDCVPVAVDLVPGATPLPDYIHPKNAFYVFGPENGTLGKSITDFCRDKIYVPMKGCMNLAACVNVVLYDRMAKEIGKSEAKP